MSHQEPESQTSFKLRDKIIRVESSIADPTLDFNINMMKA
jgi:hypothetical protein